MSYKIPKYKVINYYKITHLDSVRREHMNSYIRNKVWPISYGTTLLSKEGINGGICTHTDNFEEVMMCLEHLIQDEFIYNVSTTHIKAYNRNKIKLTAEVVRMQQEHSGQQGGYLTPEQWHDAIQHNEVLCIDTRNDYEVAIGRFKKSISIPIKRFGQFIVMIKFLLKHISKYTKILMYCTGGIRCEKTVDLLSSMGYKNLYHLKGGIQNYIMLYKNQRTTMWIGSCYLFDRRIALSKENTQDKYVVCFGCRQTISETEQKFKWYKVSQCHKCR